MSSTSAPAVAPDVEGMQWGPAEMLSTFLRYHHPVPIHRRPEVCPTLTVKNPSDHLPVIVTTEEYVAASLNHLAYGMVPLEGPKAFEFPAGDSSSHIANGRQRAQHMFLLLSRLIKLNGVSLMFLQETDFVKEVLGKQLDDLGMDYVRLQKRSSGCTNYGLEPDGVMVAWDRSKWSVKRHSMAKCSFFKANGQPFIGIALESVSSGAHLFAACTHLKSGTKPEHKAIRNSQAIEVTELIARYLAEEGLPKSAYVLGADINADYDSDTSKILEEFVGTAGSFLPGSGVATSSKVRQGATKTAGSDIVCCGIANTLEQSGVALDID